MARDRYFDDATVTIEHTALDGTLAPLAGLTDLVVSIRRLSDGQFLDWNDDTFKAAGWTMRQQVMSEVDSTNAPGDYAQDFDLSAVTNKAADDTYVARVEQTPGTSVANVPASGEFEEGLNDPSPADIDTELSSSHGAGDWDLSQADVQAAMTAQGYTAARAPGLDNLDAAVSSRAAPGDAMDLTAAAVDDVWDEPIAGHLTAGSTGEALNDAAGSVLTQQEVRDAMKLAPTAGAPAAGSVDEHLDTIEADTAAMQPLVDVAISTRSSHTAADVDTQLSGTHGAGSWATATGFATPGDVTAAQAAIQADIAALNDLSQADVQAAMTAQGYTVGRAANLDNMDATISSIAAAIAALNDLDAASVTAAVWDAAKSAHVLSGSFGEAMVAAAGHAGLHCVLDGGSGAASLPHDSNNQLTAARLRIFADKATADAATLGAADGADGELIRLFIDSAIYNAGSLAAVPTVLAALRRTAA